MTGQVLRRDHVADDMAQRFNSDVTEDSGHKWTRLNTLVLCQGDVVYDGVQADFHLLERCLDGSHRLECEGEFETGQRIELTTQPGGVSYLPCHSQLTETCEGRAEIQQIAIDRSVFRQVADEMCAGDPDRLPRLGFKGLMDPNLIRLADMVLHEARITAPGGELYGDLLAQEIALLILRRQLRDPNEVPQPRALSDRQLAKVIDYMEANLEDVGGMEVLAEAVGMSVFAFSRAFKAKTGEAPHQFLIGRRLERAKALLLKTDESLVEIAFSVGFASQSHMTATFTRRVGQPPGAWRRDVRR